MKTCYCTIVIFLLILILSAAADTNAATLTVTKIEDTADGVCDGDCSLREAIAAAASGDSIKFSSLFQLPQTIRLIKGQLVIDKDLRIDGPGSGLLTVSGNNAGRIFRITAPDTIEISAMRLTEGRLVDINSIFGGAIYLVGGSLKLLGLVIDHNFARHTSINPPVVDLGLGGGIYVNDGVLTVTNTRILNNTGPNGGGIYVNSGSLTLTDSEVSQNIGPGIKLLGSIILNVTGSKIDGNLGRGIEGSGNEQIFISDSSVSNNKGGGILSMGRTTISDSVIRGNRINGNAAGVDHSGASILTVDRCAIIENRSTLSSAGIRNQSQMYLTNSTVSGNQTGSDPSTAKGGGIRNYAQMTVTNSTIAHNEASGSGGGIHSEAGAATKLSNTLIANNSGNLNSPDFFGTATSEGYNLVRVHSGSSGWSATDLLGQDPLLAPLGFNGGNTYTYALLPGSPAINAGSNDLAVDPVTGTPFETDQRGRPRRVGSKGGVVDIGAYEANYAFQPISLEGRLLTSTGRGIGSARVVLTGSDLTRYAVTNPFGYYRFLDLPAAATYTITASDKLYSFAVPIVVTTDQDRNDLIFLGTF